jgi:hypothetical protein
MSAWKRWFLTSAHLEHHLRYVWHALVATMVSQMPLNALLSVIGPFNVQSIPDMPVVGTFLPSVWSSKIYISTVKFTVLAHPPAKDLSSRDNLQVALSNTFIQYPR